ncbi:MAG: ABC transporter ATP-binding protein [Bacillota bacterium]|nr:ABC transporter ATP-binding protein [Bacillota bacterium]
MDVKNKEDILLNVNELSVQYKTDNTTITALDKISFSIKNRENLGIIGESGSGKTTLAMSLMGLIGSPHKVYGKINVTGKDLMSLAEKDKKKLRWKTIAMVFQNSMDVLNPVMKVGHQIVEPLKETEGLSEREAFLEAERLLKLVGLEKYWKDSFPHQLSGGMRQRVLLAMAMSCSPRLLILDEPTSSLDAVTRKSLFEMVRDLQEKIGFSMLVISHDLSAMKDLTDKMMVLYGGEILERGLTREIIEEPAHIYTRGLINSSVQAFPYKDLWGIPGEAQTEVKGCVFASRCTQALEGCSEKKPYLEQVFTNREVACHRGGIVDLIRARGISKSYKVQNTIIPAVKDVILRVRHGETVALVGRSGSGKSTLAHILAGFLQPDKGDVVFDNQAVKGNWPACKEGGIQLILQDPFSSLSHRFTVEDALLEPLKVNKIGSLEERIARIKAALKDVQLPADDLFLKRHCSSLSGGQRQRIAIARGLVMKPKLLLADEITSMLDVSTQANLLRLLKGLQNSSGFAMVFITHDLHLARKIAERIIVLHHGEITEEGSSSYVTEESCCCHTKELMEAGL